MSGSPAPYVVPLTVENTVEVSRVAHRLAMGVQWIDALSQAEMTGPWCSDLEAVGARPCPQPWDLHSHGRHSLRAAGRIAKLLERAAIEKAAAPPPPAEDDPTNFVLRSYGRPSSRRAYATDGDPRMYVPRRLSLTPVQTGGVPSAGRENIRPALLWPGATYPLPSNASGVRGRVRRGPAATARSVAWARVFVTRPRAGPPDFAAETQLGWGHGDDRGEFLAALGPAAVPGGAALPPAIPLNVWVFLPPADTFDAGDPLASLPLEVAGTAAAGEVLAGTQVPAGYVERGPIPVTLTPGRVLTLNETDLLFA